MNSLQQQHQVIKLVKLGRSKNSFKTDKKQNHSSLTGSSHFPFNKSSFQFISNRNPQSKSKTPTHLQNLVSKQLRNSFQMHHTGSVQRINDYSLKKEIDKSRHHTPVKSTTFDRNQDKLANTMHAGFIQNSNNKSSSVKVYQQGSSSDFIKNLMADFNKSTTKVDYTTQYQRKLEKRVAVLQSLVLNHKKLITDITTEVQKVNNDMNNKFIQNDDYQKKLQQLIEDKQNQKIINFGNQKAIKTLSQKILKFRSQLQMKAARDSNIFSQIEASFMSSSNEDLQKEKFKGNKQQEGQKRLFGYIDQSIKGVKFIIQKQINKINQFFDKKIKKAMKQKVIFDIKSKICVDGQDQQIKDKNKYNITNSINFKSLELSDTSQSKQQISEIKKSLKSFKQPKSIKRKKKTVSQTKIQIQSQQEQNKRGNMNTVGSQSGQIVRNLISKSSENIFNIQQTYSQDYILQKSLKQSSRQIHIQDQQMKINKFQSQQSSEQQEILSKYYIDPQGYLLDDEGNIITDNNSRAIRINTQQRQILQNYHMINH